MSTAGVPFLCVATFVLFSYKRILTIFAMLHESKCISAKITLFTLKKDSQSPKLTFSLVSPIITRACV